jgi:hypothetical protein
MEGTGQFMVTAVGLSSQTGIIMKLLGATDDSEETNQKSEDKTKKKKDKKGNFNCLSSLINPFKYLIQINNKYFSLYEP